jgi:hypothetical protein
MEVLDDDVRLTGGRVITGETESTVIRYITFTATSVSEQSELTHYVVNYTGDWNVSVSLVRCTKDTSGKTFAIRVECESFLVGPEGPRELVIEGTIYTNSQNVYSPVLETIIVSGCAPYDAPDTSN